MNNCQNERCRAQLDDGHFVCVTCTEGLDAALSDLLVMLSELETTRCRQDRGPAGAVGKSDQSTLAAINVDAMNIAQEIEALLVDWTGRLSRQGLQFFPAMSVGHLFIGPLEVGWRRLPRGYSGSPEQRVRWLQHHVNAITARSDAGEFMKGIIDLVGDPDRPVSKPGRLSIVIDQAPRQFAGMCPTTRGFDRTGAPVECGVVLFSKIGDLQVECPRCKQLIEVAKNRTRAAVARDLLPESRLIEVLKDMGEPVSKYRFKSWVENGDLRVVGFLHEGQVVANQIRRRDPRLFSVSQARALRGRDEALRSA